METRWFICAAVLSAFLAGTSSSADAITWNFTGYGGEGSIGNSRSFASEGVTVTATAWSYTSTGFQAARLGLWSTGLGVCNQAETCGNPSHQVDNSGRQEYVLFQFSSAVDPLSVRIDPYGTYDRDVSYWTGNVTLPSDLLAGETYGSLTGSSGVGFFSRIDNYGSISSSPRDVSITSPYVTAMLFGPGYNSGGNDYFKITSLTGTARTTSVPEPTALLLLSLGLFGLVWLHSKRQFTA